MKYIRTSENTIVEISEKSQFYTYDSEQIVLEKGKRGIEMIRGFVRKIADTIEELCDEFLVVSYSTNKVMYQTKDYNYFDNLRKEDFRNHPTINNKYYGAIWFEGSNGEPILKSVAEMKDRGGLKLL